MLSILIIASLCLLIFASSTPVKPSDIVTFDSLRLSYKQLITYYRNYSGYFGDVDDFWTSANSIECLANYYIVSKKMNQLDDLVEIESIFENTHLKLKPFYFTYSRCYDDYLWWVLAWKRAFDATSNEKYLEQSQIIFYRLVDNFMIWNSTCGGVVWSASTQYRNAITNELFMDASTQLSLASNSTAEKLKYDSWAKKEVDWFLSTRMISAPTDAPDDTQLVIDGLPGGSCDNQVDPVGDYWTYNSGVLLDGLAHHGHIDIALNISKSAVTYFTDSSTSDKIMRELSCSAPEGFCDGQDGKMFKGVFVRHLHYFMKILHQKSTKVRNYEVELKGFQEWIVLQAESILTKASLAIDSSESESHSDSSISTSSITAGSGTPTGLLLSQLWQGPPPELSGDPKTQVITTPWISQASALEALIAAFSLLNNISYT